MRGISNLAINHYDKGNLLVSHHEKFKQSCQLTINILKLRFLLFPDWLETSNMKQISWWLLYFILIGYD